MCYPSSIFCFQTDTHTYLTSYVFVLPLTDLLFLATPSLVSFLQVAFQHSQLQASPRPSSSTALASNTMDGHFEVFAGHTMEYPSQNTYT
mgnify:FL=1